MKARQRIESLIAQFSRDLEDAIRDEIREHLVAAINAPKPQAPGRPAKKAATAALATPNSGRRARRSGAQLVEVQDRIITLLKQEPKLTSEQIQDKLGLSKEDVQRPLQLLRDEDQVKTSGQRRGMQYYVGAGRAGVVKRTKSVA